MVKTNVIGNVKKRLSDESNPLSFAFVEGGAISGVFSVNCDAGQLFQAASVSKTIAALVSLRLYKEGVIDLDSSVNNYFSSYRLVNQSGEEVDVSLRQLLNHTAGCSVRGFPGYDGCVAVPSLDQIISGESPCNTDVVLVDKVPGEKSLYSGGGYMVLQKALEEATGKPFGVLAYEKVFSVVGMDNSDFKLREVTDAHVYPESAAAGLWTTAEDLALLIIELQKSYNGESGKLLDKSLIDEMFSTDIWDGDYFAGLGIFISEDKSYFFHDGRNYNYFSMMLGSFDGKKGFVLLEKSNEDHNLAEEIRNLIW